MAKIFSFWRRSKLNPSGFETLVAPHIEPLYRLAYRFCGTQHDAEDLVQELLTRLYPKHQELAGIEQPGPWLKKSLYHLFIDDNRRDIRSPVSLMEDIGLDLDSTASDHRDPQHNLERDMSYQHLEKALLTLSLEQRSLIAMHDMEGYSLPELAAMLETPLGTLKSRLHRARARLRAQLSQGSVDDLEQTGSNEK